MALFLLQVIKEYAEGKGFVVKRSERDRVVWAVKPELSALQISRHRKQLVASGALDVGVKVVPVPTELHSYRNGRWGKVEVELWSRKLPLLDIRRRHMVRMSAQGLFRSQHPLSSDRAVTILEDVGYGE